MRGAGQTLFFSRWNCLRRQRLASWRTTSCGLPRPAGRRHRQSATLDHHESIMSCASKSKMLSQARTTAARKGCVAVAAAAACHLNRVVATSGKHMVAKSPLAPFVFNECISSRSAIVNRNVAASAKMNRNLSAGTE
jgi:hypothetical protein